MATIPQQNQKPSCHIKPTAKLHTTSHAKSHPNLTANLVLPLPLKLHFVQIASLAMDVAEVHLEQHQEKAEDPAVTSSTIEKPSLLTPSTIHVESPLDNAVPEQIPHAPSETTQSDGQGDENASRKNTKRRSGNSVDLTYRYREPSDDELSWTEDEHGTRRRRKSKKAGKSDDFKSGIVYVPLSCSAICLSLVRGE